MKIFEGLDELEKAVGTHLGHSDWLTITQEQVDLFAEATGDHQWIHVDPEKAATGPFGGTIAHGYLTLSLIPKLTWQIYKVDGLAMGVNYGANKVRFPAPVPVGSRLRAGVEVVSLVAGGGGRQLVTRVTIEREGGDKPVCVAETVSVLVPKTA
ncbi:MaoC family dehydratase [Streptomyces sp. NPDC001858]